MDKAFALSKKFILFAAIGLGLMLVYSIINWLLIDVLGGNANIIAPVGITIFFLLKYWIYVALDVIHARFIGYCIANLGLLIFSAVAIPAMIQLSPLNAFWSTGITLGGMVVLRFLIFHLLKLIRY